MDYVQVAFFFSSRRRHTRYWRDWSSDVCSSDLPTDPDALYDYRTRIVQNPAILARMHEVANTGNLQRPMITLHGDQDSLLPIATDSNLYVQLVARARKSNRHRYYVVQGGNHVDPQFDGHYGVDSYGNTVLRPMLPCVRAAVDAIAAWV